MDHHVVFFFDSQPVPPSPSPIQEMYEGLDYEENESEVTLAERQEQTARDLHRGAYARWIVLFLIG